MGLTRELMRLFLCDAREQLATAETLRPPLDGALRALSAHLETTGSWQDHVTDPVEGTA